MKLMCDFKISYDSSVRDADGSVVQFDYGDDGYDAINIVRLQIPEPLQQYNRFEFKHTEEMSILKESTGLDGASEYMTNWKKETGETLVSCPADVESFFERARVLSEGSKTIERPFHEMYSKCQKFISKIKNELFKNYLILFLQVRRMRLLNNQLFDWFLEHLEERIDKAKVHPGEMVGVLAGQSVAEPSTQM